MSSLLRSLHLAPALLYLVGQHADAQEPVPLERAREFARHLVESSGNHPGAAVKIDPDVLNPVAIRVEQSGVLVVPDRNLSSDVLANAAAALVPIGELFLRNVTLTVDGQPLDKEKFRQITVAMQDQKAEVPTCLLAASKDKEGNLELLVFGKGTEPLARTRIGKVPSQATMPIELSAEKQDENSGLLRLNLAGQYEAELLVQRSTDTP